jgi:hypothetical protein
MKDCRSPRVGVRTAPACGDPGLEDRSANTWYHRGVVRDGRSPVVVRFSPAGLAVVDELARADRVSRSEMVRRLVADGIRFRGAKGAGVVTRVESRSPVGAALEASGREPFDWPVEAAPVDASGERLPGDDEVA